MKPKKVLNFVFVIIAAIVSSALFKLFDKTTSTFDKPYLAGLYAIVVIACLVFIVKNYRNSVR